MPMLRLPYSNYLPILAALPLKYIIVTISFSTYPILKEFDQCMNLLYVQNS